MPRTKGGGLHGLLTDIARKRPTGLLAQGLPDAPPQERERVTPPGTTLAQGVVDTLRAMPGAMEHLQYGVRELCLLEHPDKHRHALIAQCIRDTCRTYGVPVAKGCDWAHAVRLLYPAGVAGDWAAEANRRAHDEGLHPHYRWVQENPLLTADEEYLAQVLVSAMRGDGAPLLALVDRICA